jgi:choline-phosphate cytidylyltransferase
MFRSEEDNDPLTDDAYSVISAPIAISRHSNTTTNSRLSHLKPSPGFRGKHHLAHNLVSDSDAGVDSPTYDGDVESSTTAGVDTQNSHKTSYHHYHHSTSSVSTLNTPITAATLNTPQNITPGIEPSNPISPVMRATNPDSNYPVFISPPTTTQMATDEPAVAAASIAAFNPAALTPDDIQSFVAKAIAGEPGRTYKINPPPIGRPVRIYADGMCSLSSYLNLQSHDRRI